MWAHFAQYQSDRGHLIPIMVFTRMRMATTTTAIAEELPETLSPLLS